MRSGRTEVIHRVVQWEGKPRNTIPINSKSRASAAPVSPLPVSDIDSGMRLLNARTLKLESFFGTQPPPYAILSHTWEQEEVLFADIQDKKTPFPDHKLGAYKVKKSCTQARQLGFDHVWIDTCCIDKTSSAELSESINSMFAWYRQADICFAFLGDVNDTNSAVKATVEGSRWFTRGWTLQELVAPRQVIFFDSQWKEIGRREPDGEVNNSAFLDMLGRATRIPSSLLCRDAAGPCSLGGLYQKANEKQHPMRLYHGTCQGCSRKDTLPMFLRDRFSNAQKMSWAARRVTTRREDQAYCMLGLFCVNMPLLYGEGEAAFIRLQEEILRKSDDPSLLAFDHFNMGKAWYTVDTGLLAPSALSFQDSQIRLPRSSRIQTLNRMTLDSKTISLHLLLCPDNGRSRSRLWLAILPCRYEDDLAARPALLLESVSHDNTVFSRVLVKEITVRPVATELNIREKSIHAGAVDATFDLFKAQLQDIRLVLKKPLAAISSVPPLRESPAIRIFLQRGVKLLRLYPDNLGHEITKTTREPSGANGVDVVNTDGTMIYIPARERTQPSDSLRDADTYDLTIGVMCLQSRRESVPFYVLFYGYRRLFPFMGDPFLGVSGRAVVQVNLMTENGDPASPEAMEAALVAEERMNKGSSSEHDKRATLRMVEFLGQVLLELVVEIGAVVEDTDTMDDGDSGRSLRHEE